MKGIAIFFMGLVTALVIGAAVAGYFFFAAVPEPAPKTVSAPQPPTTISGSVAPQPVVVRPGQDTPPPPRNPNLAEPGGNLFAKGAIFLPPALRKVLETKKDAVLTVRAHVNAISVENNILTNSADLVPKVFPYQYNFMLEPAMARQLAGTERVNLLVRATVCYDRGNKPCSVDQYPYVMSTVKMQLQVPGGAKTAMEFQVPPLVLTKHMQKFDSKACADAGNTIGGTLVSTENFKKAFPGNRATLAIIGLPSLALRPNGRVPPPYVQGVEPPRPLTQAEVQKMGDYGIISTSVTLEPAVSQKFSLRIGQNFLDRHYRLIATMCKDKEPLNDCIARSFPLKALTKRGEDPKDSFRVIAKDFVAPICGVVNHTFYLHPFAATGAQFTEQMLHVTDPPEALEGIWD